MRTTRSLIVISVCASLLACATPLLNPKQQLDFDVFAKELLQKPSTSATIAELKVESEIDRSKSITVRLIPGAQIFELPEGKSFVHLMKLPNYDKPYDLKLHLPTDESVLSLLPSVLVLDAQFQTVNRLDLVAADFQWPIGTTIFQEVTVDPKIGRYALIYSKPADFGKDFKLSIDVGIAAYSYRKMVSPIGSVTVSLVKKGCRILSCELPAPE